MTTIDAAPERCRTCNIAIVWARTTTGKYIPVEPDPTPHGNLTLYPMADHPGRLAIVSTGSRRSALAAAGIPLYVSHFVSCPNSNEWRNR